MRRYILLLFFVILAVPFFASAAATVKPKFYYAGWLPFWEKQGGAISTAINLDKLSEVNLFSYEVKPDGTLVDALKIHSGFWPGWIDAVHDMHIKIVPTIAWFRGNEIHALLSNTKKRQAHEDAIAKLVMDEKFDGIDIDYEAKLADTNPYFSTFLKGLAMRLHPKGKTLVCTIESRTPNDSRYNVDPTDMRYANDYVALNKYCDQVRLMAYDQGVIDKKLNEAKGNGKIYAPVADPLWAEKVIKEALKSISPKKIMLGVPTYGYEYEVTWENGLTTYRRLRSVNFSTAMQVADRVNAVPTRNSAGELSFAYASSTLIEVSKGLRFDVSSALPAELVALGGGSPSGTIVRYVSFTDNEAIAQKIKLAKKYGLRGVAFFKLDGQFDPMLWQQLQ